jgi:hypothetical protein
MKRMALRALGLLLMLGFVSATITHAAVTNRPEKAWIKASNKLGFALDEMRVVERNLEAEHYDYASRSYKRATKYFSNALKNLDRTNLNHDQKEALHKFQNRFEDLDPGGNTLSQSKADAMLRLIGETHDYFKVSG